MTTPVKLIAAKTIIMDVEPNLPVDASEKPLDKRTIKKALRVLAKMEAKYEQMKKKMQSAQPAGQLLPAKA